MGKSQAALARERAREVKARLDAKRAARDAQIEKWQTEFFLASAVAEQAAQTRKAAVVQMGGLDLDVSEIGELLELPERDVRALLKGGVISDAD